MAAVIPTYTAADVAVIQRVSPNLKKLRDDLIAIFPEREWQINQLVHALITGSHVLFFGKFGSAKSMLINTLLNAIVGPGVDGNAKRVFWTTLDSEVVKTDLLGPIVYKKFEEGELEYNLKLRLAGVDFAFLDEFFDAPHVLRLLLEIIHERKLTEMVPAVDVPLMSMFAATNRSPQEIEELFPQLQLGAVNDRIMFVSTVDYLTEEESQMKMLADFVMSVRLSATIDFADLQRVREIIRRSNQFPDAEYLRIYNEIINTYEKLMRTKISDRRRAWLTQIIEAQAALHGRAELAIDDILAAVLGLAESAQSKEAETFRKIAEAILTKARQIRKEKTDEAARTHLARLQTAVTQAEQIINAATWPANNAEIGPRLHELANLLGEIGTVNPTLEANETLKTRLAARVQTLQKVVFEKATKRSQI